MKKITLVFAILLVFGAGQAMAAFDSDTLIISVYNNATDTYDAEVGIDTGFSIDLESGMDWSTPFSYTVETGLNLGQFGTETWADLEMGVYGYDETTRFYIGTTDSSYNSINGGQFQPFISATNNAKGEYYNAAEGADVAILANNTVGNTYDMVFNQEGAVPGQYNGFNENAAVGEANLGDLASGGSVTMYLYGYKNEGFFGETGLLTNTMDPNVPYLATLTLDSNGTVTIQNTPIPGALWLFGSALLGLVGLRRKNA